MFVYHVHIWCSRGQMRVLDVLELGSQLLAVSWVLGPKPRSAARWLTVKNSNLAPSIPFCYLTVGRRKTGFPCIFISGFLCRSGGTQTPFWLLRSHHFLFFCRCLTAPVLAVFTWEETQSTLTFPWRMPYWAFLSKMGLRCRCFPVLLSYLHRLIGEKTLLQQVSNSWC